MLFLSLLLCVYVRERGVMSKIPLAKHFFTEYMMHADGVNTQTYLWLSRLKDMYLELTRGRENLVKIVFYAMSTILPRSHRVERIEKSRRIEQS